MVCFSDSNICSSRFLAPAYVRMEGALCDVTDTCTQLQLVEVLHVEVLFRFGYRRQNDRYFNRNHFIVIFDA